MYCVDFKFQVNITMKVQKINQTTNFKSGLSRKIIAESNAINFLVAESEMIKSYGINIDLKGFKPNVFCVKKALEILNYLGKKLKLKTFKSSIPNIVSYTNQDLTFPFDGYGFCLLETQQPLKNEAPFETGSIFYPQENFLEELDMKIENSYKKHERSSSHFLSTTFHEIFHEKYIDHIYKKYGYTGKCPYTAEKYPDKHLEKSGLDVLSQLRVLTLKPEENDIVKSVLGNYSSSDKNQYHEIFAEAFTKLICDSLSSDLVPQVNPMENLKKYPKEFLQILNKVLNV